MAWTADKEQQYRALRTERAGAMAGLIQAIPRTLLEGVQPPSEEEFAETLASNAAELVHGLTAFLPSRPQPVPANPAPPQWPPVSEQPSMPVVPPGQPAAPPWASHNRRD